MLNTKATLIDACSQLLQVIYITDHTQVIPLNNYAPGIYFLKMENGENIKLILR